MIRHIEDNHQDQQDNQQVTIPNNEMIRHIENNHQDQQDNQQVEITNNQSN